METEEVPKHDDVDTNHPAPKDEPKCKHGNPLMDCKQCDDWLHEHLSGSRLGKGRLRRG